MFPASTNGGGNLAIPGPLDACKTPTPGGPVPMPYPNFGMCTQANGGSCSQKVKFMNKKVLTKKSEITMSTGDEAGTVGGVVSNRFKGPIKFKKGSSKVKAEGQAVVHLTSMTGHNGSNANVPAGVQVAPSQTKVIVAP
jgi:hypothetical protein